MLKIFVMNDEATNVERITKEINSWIAQGWEAISFEPAGLSHTSTLWIILEKD